MRMSIAPSEDFGGNQPQVIALDHGTNVLYWDAKFYHKKAFSSADWCKHINDYWARLPMGQQEKIWDVYCRIHRIFETTSDPELTMKMLIPLVVELTDLHPIDAMGTFLAFHAPDVILPSDMDDVYTAKQDTPTTREKTYTKPDYQKLLALTLGLRTMIPVWGMFIDHTRGETGTEYKELEAYRLLAPTKYATSEPLEKLRIYVEKNIRPDNTMQDAIMRGVGSEDYPEWLLALVTTRRLCVGDLAPSNPEKNLAKFIYNFIVYKNGNDTSTNFGDPIRKKEFESGDPSNENNASRLEGYKIKQEYSVGEVAILEHFLENLEQVGRHLDPNMDLDLLRRLTQTAETALESVILAPGPRVLAQWVMSPILAPSAMMHLSKRMVIRAMALSQTWLWEHGHKQLACLATAAPADGGSMMMLSGSDSKARLTQELKDQMEKLFPYTRVSSSRQRTKPTLTGEVSVNALTQLLGQNDWRLTLPKDMVDSIQLPHLQMRYSCPYEVRVLLAQLLVEVVQIKPPVSIAEDYAANGVRPYAPRIGHSSPANLV